MIIGVTKIDCLHSTRSSTLYLSMFSYVVLYTMYNGFRYRAIVVMVNCIYCICINVFRYIALFKQSYKLYSGLRGEGNGYYTGEI